MAANGFQVGALPADDSVGSTSTTPPRVLADDPPGLVHLTPLASHRGSASRWGSSPMCAAISVCRWWSTQRRRWATSTVRSARTLSTARRGNGWPARAAWAYWQSRPELAQRLRPRLPPPEWDLPFTVMQRLEHGEANVAAHVGFSVALGEHLAAGPEQIRDRLAELGRLTRTALAEVNGWRVVEPVDEPTSITTLAPMDGADPQKVRRG